jgi:hypothetical protein
VGVFGVSGAIRIFLRVVGEVKKYNYFKEANKFNYNFIV